MRLVFSRNFTSRPPHCVPALLAAITSIGIAHGAAVTQKDVLPILEKNCFQCHGESLKMANLDLRTRAAMLKGGDKGPAVVPGKYVDNQVYKRADGPAQLKMTNAP